MTGRQRYCILILFWIFVFSAPVAGAELTVLYTANTFGEAHPCPTCGKKKLGGLSRRASIFSTLHRTTPADELLTVAGPYEFSPLEGPVPVPVSSLVRAFQLMEYDFGVLSHADLDVLGQFRQKLPGWQSLSFEPKTHIIQTGIGPVGFLLFPFLKGNFILPTNALMQSVNEAAGTLKKSTVLIIGISSWGAQGEKYFLESGPTEVNILLGSGAGPGLNGALHNKDRTLWIRPFEEGKSIQQIQILKLPPPGSIWKWQKGVNIKYAAVPLWEDIPTDERIDALF